MKSRGLRLFCLAILPLAALMKMYAHAAEGENTTSAVQIDHLPITFAEAGKSIPVEAQMQTPGRGIVYLRVYYRSTGQSSFRYSEMRPAAQGYLGEIPASFVKPPSLQYFLLALLSDQSVMSMPSRNPYGQPFEILVTAPNRASEPRSSGKPNEMPGQSAQPESEQQKNETPKSISPQLFEKLRQLESSMAEAEDEAAAQNEEAPSVAASTSEEGPILILSPEPMSTVSNEEVLISASFDPQFDIAPASIQVLLNGRDLTEQADLSPFLVSLNPGKLRSGEYRVALAAEDKSGQKIGPVSWRFQVEARGGGEPSEGFEKKSLASGVVFVDTQHEKFNSVPFDNNSVGGNLEGQNGLLSYRADLFLTSLEDRAFQPRHRFAFTASVPLLTVTLGDAVPYLNDLVLWGRRVRGVQARFYTGWLNVDFIKGETVREVTPVLGLRNGTFSQSLLGVRPSFGGKTFQLGFMFLKASDDTTSIDPNTAGVAPRSNLVLGSDVLLALMRNRIQFKASVAHAFVTNNTRLPILSKDSVASQYGVDLPFDPASLKSWIVVNESLTPLDPTGGSGLAYQMGFEFNYFNHFITAGFKQIGSQYISFGHAFLRKDIRGFYVNDRWRMLNNRLFLNAGFERYRDHFDAIDNNPSAVLNTIQFGFAINWAPGLPSVNFNFRNHNRDNNIDSLAIALLSGANPDTITTDRREDNRTRDFSFIVNQDVQALNLQHTISLGVTSSARVDRRVDRFGGTRGVGIPASDIVSNLQSLTVRSRFQVPLITTLSFATNQNRSGGQLAPFKYNSLNAQAEYTFPRPSVRAYAGLRFVKASGQFGKATDTTITVIDYAQTGLQVGGSIIFNKQHELVLDLGLLKYNDAGGKLNVPSAILTRNSSFTNAFIRGHYEFRF